MIVRVAAVQAEPVHLELRATLDRTRLLVARAAAQGARVVAFPETWLPGYPAWLDCCRDVGLWDHAPVKRVFVRLRENAVVVPGPATAELGALAREHDLVLSVGVHERVDEGPGRGTLYNAMLTFAADGTLVNHYRKLMPTFTERLIWGGGNGSGLRAVATDRGRIGGLICWEHWMPLARQVLHDSGEDIHVAAWPQLKEMNLVASRHYAFEGRTFVIACGGLMQAGSLPAELETPEALRGRPEALVLRGGSAIIAPDGSFLAGPLFDEETVLFADLDLSRVAAESLTLDVTGHYQRPDVFELRLKQN